MCAEVTCKQCGRPSWKGCGQHVEQVLGHVAREDRCQCHRSHGDEEPTLVRTSMTRVKERSESPPAAPTDGASTTPTLRTTVPFSGLRLREGVTVDSQQWDERYSGDELVWTSTPNQFLVAEVVGLPAGRAVDLACGEGRNSIWLAENGWEVTGVDFSPVGLAKAKRFADLWGVEVTWVESAVENWTPPPDGFDLVAVLYLQLPQPARSAALAGRRVRRGPWRHAARHRSRSGQPDPGVRGSADP